MLDTVFIHQLEILAKIGVYDWEQTIDQKLVLDIEMAYSNQAAGESDDLKDALDYSKVCEAIISHIRSTSFKLIERVAHEVAQIILDNFQVPWVKVRVTKPSAVVQAAGVGVEIERGHR